MSRFIPVLLTIICSCSMTAQTDKERHFSKEQLLSDYDYYFHQMELIHPDPYSSYGGKAGFDHAVKELRNELANRNSLSLNEMQVEMTKMLSALHDGHTNVGYPEMPQKVADGWVPLKFKVIPDGLIVTMWRKDLESLKGARLLEVEGEPLDTLLGRLDKMVITENQYGLLGRASKAICHNNSLRQLFPGFDKDSVSMKLKLVCSKDTVVTLPFYPNGPIWGTFVWASADSRFPKENFEFRFTDDNRQTMVICINQIVSADVPGYKESKVVVADAFGKMLHEMKSANSPRLVIDLRGNGGGWTMIMYAALYELYGEKFLKTDLGLHFATKVSEAMLKKRGFTSLEQFNQTHGTSLKIGESYIEPSEIGSIDEFLCADMSLLDSLHGAPIYTPKEIYVVTDESTFSAAFHFAFMMSRMGAKIVGVPSGQAPNTFMELTQFRLPNSGLECSVSNSLQDCFPNDHPKAKVFTPDVQLTYKDYQDFDFSTDAELLFIIKE